MADEKMDEQLRSAIEAFKKACGDDSSYKRVIDRLDDAERELADIPDGDSDDEVEKQPKDLKAAAEKTRAEFASRRKASSK